MKLSTALILVLTSALGGCSKEVASPPAAAGPSSPPKVVATPPSTPQVSIKFERMWTHAIGTRGGFYATEFTNTGATPIKAFSGKWVEADDLGKETDSRIVEYTSATTYVKGDAKEARHLIAPGETICVVVILNAGDAPVVFATATENVAAVAPYLKEVWSVSLVKGNITFHPDKIVAP